MARMAGDFPQRSFEQLFSRRDAVPGGGAGRDAGSGMRSKHRPARSRNGTMCSITSSSFLQSINCAMAKWPTGTTRRAFRIWISSSIQEEQLRTSSGAGTQSPPLSFFRENIGRPPRNKSSSERWLHSFRKILRTSGKAFCQQCAQKAFAKRVLGAGACPMSITSLTTAPPETGVDCMRGQRRHRRRPATWSSSRV